jgi:hypothetical protein
MSSSNRWIFTKEEIENSPSRQDDISSEREKRDRARGIADISFLAQKLKAPAHVVAAASILFHRQDLNIL